MHEADDLKMLREAWDHPDPPSSRSHAEARAALLHRASHDHPEPAQHPATRRRRPSWRLAFSAAVATTAAAAIGFAFVQLASTPGVPPPSDEPGAPDGVELSAGHQILLAAAETAREQPADVGEYWYVEEEIDLVDPAGLNPQTLEIWTAADGRQWTRNRCCPDVNETNVGPGFSFASSVLTLEELQSLPTDGEQLKAWITESFAASAREPVRDPDAPAEAPRESTEEPQVTEDAVAFALTDLLSRVPAPPDVRAAAFRALATMPDVTSLGDMDGGEGLRIAIEPPAADKFPDGEVPEGADNITVVIDPETSQLLSFTNYQGTTRIHAAQWTDQRPASTEPPVEDVDPAAPPPQAD